MSHDLEAAVCKLRQAMEKCFQQDRSGRTIFSIAIEEVFPFQPHQHSYCDSPALATCPAPDNNDEFSWITKMVKDAFIEESNKIPTREQEAVSTQTEAGGTNLSIGTQSKKVARVTDTRTRVDSRKTTDQTTPSTRPMSIINRRARAISGRRHTKGKPPNTADRLAEAIRKVDKIGQGVRFQ